MIDLCSTLVSTQFRYRMKLKFTKLTFIAAHKSLQN